MIVDDVAQTIRKVTSGLPDVKHLPEDPYRSIVKDDIVINNGRKKMGIDPVNFINTIQNIGVGEIIINSIVKIVKIILTISKT